MGTMTPSNDGPDNNNEESNDYPNQAQEVLAEYMEAGSPPPASWQRIPCCNSSRYLYCEVCCRMLVPELPAALYELEQLPFDIHVLLDDRRASSTGIQVASIFQQLHSENPKAKVFDMERGEIPSYDGDEGTYLLFPGESSVPLSTLLNDDNNNKKISTLVVLDCKWAKSRSRLDAFGVHKLPQVFLDHPPSGSYYWRWHNTGPGMLSTVEAIYFAAWQITSHLRWTLEERKQRLVHLLWLFRLQRALIQSKYQNGQVKGANPHVPFTEEAKEFSRGLRRQKEQQQVKN